MIISSAPPALHIPPAGHVQISSASGSVQPGQPGHVQVQGSGHIRVQGGGHIPVTGAGHIEVTGGGVLLNSLV